MGFLSSVGLNGLTSRTKKVVQLSLLAVALQHVNAKAVLWETQADRLQMVSGALLDGTPVLTPAHRAGFSLRILADISFLPKPNPKVGAKSEKVPASPVHAIPSLEAGAHFKFGHLGLGAKIYGGYLPALPQAVTQLKAKVSQSAYGGFLQGSYLIAAPWEAFGAVGAHWTKAVAKGPIASKDKDDVFDVKTQISMIGGGVTHTSWGVYASYMAALRKSRSKFVIVEDNTDLTLDDNMSDAKIPFASQVSVGWVPAHSPYSVSLSFLFVPSRLYMPRLSVSYAFIEADLQTGEASSAESSPATKPSASKSAQTKPTSGNPNSAVAAEDERSNDMPTAAKVSEPADSAPTPTKIRTKKEKSK